MSEAVGKPSLVIGVDVGGTFTDIFVLDEALARIEVLKVASSVGQHGSDQSLGFLTGIEAALKRVGKTHADIAVIVHGTTAGTNALLERKIARTGLITTRGFRDVLEMRRRDRPSTWGLWGKFEPIIERRLRTEVDERVLADGQVLVAADLAQIRAQTHFLLEQGCEAIVIAFINAYANPSNESAALAAARQAWIEKSTEADERSVYLSASHQILPEIREFERTSTAALNAALQPVVGRYVERLDNGLKQRGFAGQLLIVQSNGGVMDVASTCAAPVKTALSGPAAGVMACAFIAREAGWPDVITGDMGGTSFDVSLIAQGVPAVASQTSIEFGMVIRSPMIEITTIGAGGGSVATVDRSGLLQVGPQSAGSYPGPVCYGLRSGHPQGLQLGPCVTDANVVLGRINAQRPIGAADESEAKRDARSLLSLDVDAARESIRHHVAVPLGLSIEGAAEAILAVANAKMAGAIRLVSIERGHDPKQFAYMPFGGGGALHVCAMMQDVGVTQGIVPRYPGVTSALGCVIADMRRDYVLTMNQALTSVSMDRLRSQISTFVEHGFQALERSGVRFNAQQVHVELDMLYQGQSHTLSVPLGSALAQSPSLQLGDIAAAFEHAYRASFGQTLEAVPLRLMNLRVAVIGLRPKFDLSVLAPSASPSQASQRHLDALGPNGVAPASSRRVYVDQAWRQVTVYARADLSLGTVLDGPALIEQADATIWLEPGFVARLDLQGNLLVNKAST
jgi:N-methylhydantoinase A